MSKTLGYYTSSKQVDKLCEKFGCELEFLDRTQKLQLRTILIYFVLGQEEMGDEYSIYDALSDSLQHLFIKDEELEECVEMLQGISVPDAESLQLALLEQCRSGNAQFKLKSEEEEYFDLTEEDELIAQYGRDNLRFVRDQQWVSDDLEHYLGKYQG